MKENCENCKYSVEIVDDFISDPTFPEIIGSSREAVICRRYPPVPCTPPKTKITKLNSQYSWGWPVIGKTQWCGEYVPKEKQTE
ncbi:MAG: hypothetical protein FVQ85_08390 [Planctomycetes bacterium]|nr:hypothetical protein [Planctomycetota bacterium]